MMDIKTHTQMEQNSIYTQMEENDAHTHMHTQMAKQKKLELQMQFPAILLQSSQADVSGEYHVFQTPQFTAILLQF